LNIPFINLNNKTPPVSIRGVSIGVNNLRGLCGSQAVSYNDMIIRKLAQDLARFKVVSDDKPLNKKLNQRANELETSTDFWEEYFYRYLTNGFVAAHKKYLVILPIEIMSDLTLDNNFNFEYEGITMNLKDLIIMKNNNYVNQSYVTNLISKKLYKLLESMDSSSVKNFIVKLKTQLKPEEMEVLKNDLTKLSDSGMYIIDNKIDEMTPLNGTNTFDREMYDLLNKDVLALYGLNPNIMNNTASEIEIENYRTETLGPIWNKLQEELNYKYKKVLKIIPKYKLNMSDAQVKQIAMFGGITIDEIRAVYGLGKVPGGDKLIQNWNQKGDANNGETGNN
jgi:hypothetical protein